MLIKIPRKQNMIFFSFGAAIIATMSFFSLSSLITINESFVSLHEYDMTAAPPNTQPEIRCALLFFGLPRSYETIVLPSIVKHVLQVNMQCDVYAHAIMRTEEDEGRSGKGGTINTSALHLLKEKVHKMHNSSLPLSPPHVAISTETEDDFWRIRNESIQRYRTTKDSSGKLLYFPWKMHFTQETVDNIVRQWHSIESVWQLMEQHAEKLGVKYDSVGMFRSDVFFATPIDVNGKNNNGTLANPNQTEAVYPGFALFPVNDRMIYGSYNAVKTWASQRFELLEKNAHKIPGKALHPETFLHEILFPTLRDGGTNVTANPDICFFRVRADESLWINDCLQGKRPFAQVAASHNPKWVAEQKQLVENMIGRTCRQSNFNAFTLQLECAVPVDKNSTARL